MAANRPEVAEATLAMTIAIPIRISTSTPEAEQAVDTTAIRILEFPDDAGGTDVIVD
ncbi:MAG: hypothetical protein IT581_14080 [Verrucomicrobiales bacterium]|nr:hypothetical protein [Verrucomicrobiales bacterium]